MNILERMRAGELIFDTDPEYPSLYAEFEKTMKLVAQLNSGYHTPEEIRDLLGRIWGQPLDESVRMFPPFYTNFGKFTRVGRGEMKLADALSQQSQTKYTYLLKERILAFYSCHSLVE